VNEIHDVNVITRVLWTYWERQVWCSILTWAWAINTVWWHQYIYPRTALVDDPEGRGDKCSRSTVGTQVSCTITTLGILPYLFCKTVSSHTYSKDTKQDYLHAIKSMRFFSLCIPLLIEYCHEPGVWLWSYSISAIPIAIYPPHNPSGQQYLLLGVMRYIDTWCQTSKFVCLFC